MTNYFQFVFTKFWDYVEMFQHLFYNWTISSKLSFKEVYTMANCYIYEKKWPVVVNKDND